MVESTLYMKKGMQIKHIKCLGNSLLIYSSYSNRTVCPPIKNCLVAEFEKNTALTRIA